MIVSMLIIAKTIKTDDHGIISNRIAANGGPTTCPAESKIGRRRTASYLGQQFWASGLLWLSFRLPGDAGSL